MEPLTMVGISVVGGLLNALGNNSERENMEKRKKAALSILQENIIDQGEINNILASINKTFNVRLASTLNSTALKSRSVANSNLVKGAVAGSVEGQRLEALVNSERSILEANRQTRGQMAQVEANAPVMPGNSLTDFVTGAAAAFPMGNELSKMFTPSNNTTTTTSLPGDGLTKGSTYNPFTSGVSSNLNLNLPKYEDPTLSGPSAFSQIFK